MAWLLDVEKFLKISLFVFDATHERGRHTDRQTPHDSIGIAYASHAARCDASHVNFDSFVAFMCIFRSEICDRPRLKQY